MASPLDHDLPAMRLIIQSVRAKSEASDCDELAEFCEFVRSGLEQSAFFSAESPKPIHIRRAPPGPLLLQLLQTLCAT